MTTLSPKLRAARLAASGSEWRSDRAVGTPAAAMTSLAVALEASISDAVRVGPKIGSPRARKRSTIPDASGA